MTPKPVHLSIAARYKAHYIEDALCHLYMAEFVCTVILTAPCAAPYAGSPVGFLERPRKYVAALCKAASRLRRFSFSCMLKG